MKKLEKELGLKEGIASPAHEAVLNIYYTGDLLKKRAREFFREFGITDVQFNLMELLYRQAGDGAGLTQADLSRMLLVNRSNITSLIDRMEKAGLVRRVDVPGDRRYNSVELTPRGKGLLSDLEDGYMAKIGEVMSALGRPEMEELISALEKIRQNLRKQGDG